MAEPTVLQAAGVTRITLKTTSTCKVGDLIGHDGTDWVLADADARIPARFVALETHPIAGEVVSVCESGVLYDSDAPYTAGQSQYLSATAGAHTATVPAISTTLTQIQRIGRAISTDTVVFNVARRSPDILRANVAYNPASLGAVTARSDTATLTGLLTTDVLRNVPAALLTGTGWDSGLIIQSMLASNADEITFRLSNPTAGALDGAAETVEVWVERL